MPYILSLRTAHTREYVASMKAPRLSPRLNTIATLLFTAWPKSLRALSTRLNHPEIQAAIPINSNGTISPVQSRHAHFKQEYNLYVTPLHPQDSIERQ